MPKVHPLLAAVTVAALPVMLSACGGGDGGVSSTPSPSYTKISDLTGNQTFQSASVHWTAGTGGLSNRAPDAFGSGPVFAYNAASDTFTVTATGVNPVTFRAQDYRPNESTATSDVFAKDTGERLVLTTPTVNSVPLSYTIVASFRSVSGPSGTTWTAVGGMPTIASDMPKSGTSTYSVSTGGNVLAPPASGPLPTTQYSTTGNSTATFSANFAAGTVNTSLHLVGVPLTGGSTTDFGTFTGTGTISATTPGFTGSFAGTTGSGFSGAFFGPKAAEMAYAYNFTSGSIEAFGGTVGVKQ